MCGISVQYIMSTTDVYLGKFRFILGDTDKKRQENTATNEQTNSRLRVPISDCVR